MKKAVEDVKLNKIMGNYFKLALSYLMLLPIEEKHAHLSFSELPKKVREDLFKSTINFMGEPTELLFGKSPLELTLIGDTSLLEDYLNQMANGKEPTKRKDS